jgi:hypothetical protein
LRSLFAIIAWKFCKVGLISEHRFTVVRAHLWGQNIVHPFKTGLPELN